MAKTKIIILRIVVFLLVFVGTAFVINYFMSENPPLLYDSEANIRVWLDSNRNGVRENNEPFLSNICVWAGYASQFQYLGGWQKICSNKYFLSDSSGAWSHFFPGGSCSDIYNAINPPENYFPTTPTIANGCSVEFGLSQERPVVEIKSQDAGSYLAKLHQKEETITYTKTGLLILLISVFAGFVAFKTIRPVKAKAGYG